MSARIRNLEIVAIVALAFLAALALEATPASATQGFGYGDPRSESLRSPQDVERVPGGFLLLESGRRGLLSRVNLDNGVFSPLAGGGRGQMGESAQPARSVRLIFPYDIAVTDDGVLVNEPGFGRIGLVAGSSIRAVVDDPATSSISLAALPGGSFLYGDYLGYEIRRVAPDGTSVRAAGTGKFGLSPDGSRQPESRIMYPQEGIAPTSGGGFVYAENAADYSAVREVAADGTVTTLAGGHGLENSGDGGPAAAAKLGEIKDLAIDGQGDVLVATANRVREIAEEGLIRTVAGSGESNFNDDGIPATEANLAKVLAVSPTPDGGFLLLSAGRIRKVGADGVIRTVAGMPKVPNCDEPRYNGIQGTGEQDELRGRRLVDLIRGEGDDDRLTGGAGRDCLLSGLGDDVVRGGNDGDRIFSDNGADYGDGGAGRDVLVGEGANDDLRGGRGGDHLDGGSGDDRLRGDDGRDHLYGDTGKDVLVGGAGRDRIDAFTNESYGGPSDVIRCGPGRDRVKANSYDRVSRSCEVVKGPAGDR